jgi:branched-subunit amino acid transport protein
MREVASVVGLLLSLLTRDVIWVILLGGAALVSMLVHWPRRAALEDWLQQQGIPRR